jgi:uncharacterized Fe-S cluster protein YjdI
MDIPGLPYRNSGSGYMVASWTASGGWQSIDTIGLSTSYDVRFDITVDSNGDVWVSGACHGTVYLHGTSYSGQNSWNICIVKRDATNGWNAIYRSSYYSNPRLDVITDHPSGGIVMWVRSGNWARPTSGSINVYYYPGALIRLHSSNGSSFWMGQPTCTSSNCNYVTGLDMKPNGDVIIAGYFGGSMSFPNCCSVNSGGGTDGYVAQFNNSGTWDWSIALGGTSNDYAYGIRYIGNGSIAVVGSKSGVISVGLTTLSSAGTGFVAMASDAGTWEWAAQPTGSTVIQRVVATGNGTIEVAGVLQYSNSARTFGLDSLDSSDGDDIFLSRMSADADADGITNNRDNCASIYNPSQINYDGDTQGDICDADDDDEGISDVVDACPLGALAWTSNNSTDHDSDGCKDDVEDSDDDDDGRADVNDACPTGALNWTSVQIWGDAANTTDHDLDGCKDSNEDADDDDDTVNDTIDSCPLGSVGWVSTPGSDHDGDGCRDAGEDLDDDDDGLNDSDDSCSRGDLNWVSNQSTDNDADGCRDAGEDLNDDNDDFPDYDDSCPNGTVGWNSGSITDYDADGCKDDGEDLDDDADGIPDSQDNCPRSPMGWRTNPTVDFDADGCHDQNEDWDDDGDGVSDLEDLCLRTAINASANQMGCAPGESPTSTGGGGGNVTWNVTEEHVYNNNTYVNNTYVNNTYDNSSHLNSSSSNTTLVNNTFDNQTFANQSWDNTTYLNETNVEQDLNQPNLPLDVGSNESNGIGFDWIGLSIASILFLILLMQMLSLVGRRRDRRERTNSFDQSSHIDEMYESEMVDGDALQVMEMDIAGTHSESELEQEFEESIQISQLSPEALPENDAGPPLNVDGFSDGQGFEWLEWPEGSGHNHYRKVGSGEEWVLWPED